MKKKLILGLLCGCMVFGSSSVWASSADVTDGVAGQQAVVDESTTGETESTEADSSEANSNEEITDETNSNEATTEEEQGIYYFDVNEELSDEAEGISDELDNDISTYSVSNNARAVSEPVANGWRDDANGRHYYINGVMQTGWIQDGSNWYFATDDGSLLQNQWLWRPSGWYWLGSGGIMATGLTNVGGTTYYMNEAGTMTVGWVLLGNDYYYFNPDGGGMFHGWLRRPSGWYYLNDETGKMDTGWKLLGSNWYYLNPGNGDALYGWQFINGKWYYLSDTIEDCSMKTGWIKTKGTWYYCMPDGDWKSLNVAVVGANDGNSNVCAAAMQKLGMNPTVVTCNYNPNNYDAMIIPGGGDIDPSRYGERNTASKNINNALDDYQINAIRATNNAGKPILGICKGIQLVNVTFGGSLNQNIGCHMGVWHRVYATNNNWCSDLANCGKVLSYHHQSIKNVAPGFVVDLKAADGTVEAIHSTSGKVYGVQFHPEQMNNELGVNYLKRVMEKFIF